MVFASHVPVFFKPTTERHNFGDTVLKFVFVANFNTPMNHQILALFVMFIKSMNFIRRSNRGNFYFSNQSSNLGLVKVVMKKMQNFSSISLKLCLLGQNYSLAHGV